MHSLFITTALLTFIITTFASPTSLRSETSTAKGIAPDVDIDDALFESQQIEVSSSSTHDFTTTLHPRQLQCFAVSPGQCQLISTSWLNQVDAVLQIVDSNCNQIGYDGNAKIGQGGFDVVHANGLTYPSILVKMVIGIFGYQPELWSDGVSWGPQSSNPNAQRCQRMSDDGLNCITVFNCH